MKDYGKPHMWMNMRFSRPRSQCTLTGRMYIKQTSTSVNWNGYQCQTLLLHCESTAPWVVIDIDGYGYLETNRVPSECLFCSWLIYGQHHHCYICTRHTPTGDGYGNNYRFCKLVIEGRKRESARNSHALGTRGFPKRSVGRPSLTHQKSIQAD